MNSFLLHGRRAFRSSATAGASTWTFDISSMTYTSRSKSFGTNYGWMTFTPDGRLFLTSSDRVLRSPSLGWPCIFEYDQESPSYDPNKPYKVGALKDSPSVISLLGPWSQGSTVTRDGVNFYNQTHGTIRGLQGEWYVKTQLNEAWNIRESAYPRLDLTLNSVPEQTEAYASRGFVAPFAADARAGCCDVSFDGKRLYFLNSESPYNLICKMLVDAHDLSSMRQVTVTTLPLSSMNIGTPNWFQLSEDGYRLLILTSSRTDSSSSNTTKVHSYDLEAAWDIGTIRTHQEVVLYQNSPVGWATAMAVFPDQSGAYVFFDRPSPHIREFLLTTVS